MGTGAVGSARPVPARGQRARVGAGPPETGRGLAPTAFPTEGCAVVGARLRPLLSGRRRADPACPRLPRPRARRRQESALLAAAWARVPGRGRTAGAGRAGHKRPSARSWRRTAGGRVVDALRTPRSVLENKPRLQSPEWRKSPASRAGESGAPEGSAAASFSREPGTPPSRCGALCAGRRAGPSLVLRSCPPLLPNSASAASAVASPQAPVFGKRGIRIARLLNALPFLLREAP